MGLLGNADRILVFRPDNIGDVVLTAPLFRNLRQARPSATLGLLASPAGASAAPLLPWVDEVVIARPSWQALAAGSGRDTEAKADADLDLIERLRGGRWDAAIIATSFRQTAWPPAYAALLAGIPIRIGFASDFGGSLLTDVVPPPSDHLHQALRNLELLRATGVPIVDDRPEVGIPAPAALAVRGRLGRIGIAAGEPIVLVPGASAPARRMDAPAVAHAAARAGRATGRPLIVVTTAREGALRDAVIAAEPSIASIGDDLSVPEFAALVAAASVVVCGNSSALHLADATGRPVVVAYSGTDLPSQWAPRQVPAALLQRPVDCSPCYRIECPIGNACLHLDDGELAARIAAFALPGTDGDGSDHRHEHPAPVRAAAAMVAGGPVRSIA